MASTNIPVVPPVAPYQDQSSWPQWLGAIARTLNLVLNGKQNVTTTVTLTAGVTTTTLYDSRIGYFSVVLLMPTTANAAGALATTYIAPGDGNAVITHLNAATVDRTFRVGIWS